MHSKERTTNIEFKFKILVRDKDLFSMTKTEVLLAVETVFYEDDFRNESCRESKVIWVFAYESIINALLETSVNVLRALPIFFEVAISVEIFLFVFVLTLNGTSDCIIIRVVFSPNVSPIMVES